MTVAKNAVTKTWTVPTGINNKKYSNTPDTGVPPTPLVNSPITTGSTITVTWTVQPDAETEVYGFYIYVNGVRVTAGTVDTTATTYSLTNQLDGSYQITVSAVDAYGNASPQSVPVTAIVSTTGSIHNPRFPRSCLLAISTPHGYDSLTYRNKIAQFDMALLTHWNGWESGRTLSMQQTISYIKQTSVRSKGTLVFIYVNGQEANIQDYLVQQAWQDKVESMGWWVYLNGTSGPRVPSEWDAGNNNHFEINQTTFAPRDSATNYGPVEWYMNWRLGQLYNGTPQSPAIPSLDGVMHDNLFWQKRVNGDYDRDGITDSPQTETMRVAMRTECAKMATWMTNNHPNKYIIGNTDLYVAYYGGNSATPEFQDKFHGFLHEGVIGFSWARETWGTWDFARLEYYKLVELAKAPKIVWFGSAGGPTDYALYRYCLTTCLLNDGYHTHRINESPDVDSAIIFDEMLIDLGYPIQPPPTAAWKNGLWRRDYENGIAIVNPKGNGTQTNVALDGTFRRINGTQDAATNNGATNQTTITLTERNGIVLLNQ